MKRAYTILSRLSLFLVGLCMFSFVMSVAEIGSYDAWVSVASMSLCAFIPLLALTAVAGVFHLIQRQLMPQQNLVRYEKPKRDHHEPLRDADDDAQLARIMSRLNADEQAYLRELLASRRMGLSSDGELMSLDDVLKRYDQDQT